MGIDAHEAAGGTGMEDGAAVILLPNYEDESIDELCAQRDGTDVVKKVCRATGRSNWICTYCHKSFIKERQLRGHLRQHSHLINKSASGKARRMRRRMLQKARQQARRVDVTLPSEEEMEEDAISAELACVEPESSNSPESSGDSASAQLPPSTPPHQQPVDSSSAAASADDFQTLSVGAAENKFKCNLCPATCYNRSGLGAHMRMHKMSPNGRLTPAQIRNIKRRSGRVYCPHCGKDYSRSDQITRHIKHNCPVLLNLNQRSMKADDLNPSSTDRISDLYSASIRLSKGAISMVPRQSFTVDLPLSSSTNCNFLNSDLTGTLTFHDPGAWSSPSSMDNKDDNCYNNPQELLPPSASSITSAGGHNRRKSRKPVKMVDGSPVKCFLSPCIDEAASNENKEPPKAASSENEIYNKDDEGEEEAASADDFQFSCNICFLIFKDGRSLGIHNRSVHEVPDCGNLLLNKSEFFNKMRRRSDVSGSEKSSDSASSTAAAAAAGSPTQPLHHPKQNQNTEEISPNQVLTLRIFNIKDPARIKSELQFQKDDSMYRCEVCHVDYGTLTQLEQHERTLAHNHRCSSRSETTSFLEDADNSTTEEDYPCGLVLDLTEEDEQMEHTDTKSDDELEEGEVHVENNGSSINVVSSNILISNDTEGKAAHSFFCPHCSTECYTKSGLGAHMRIHRKSPQGELTATQLSNLRRRKGRVHCPHCLKDYSRSDQIARHIRHNCPAFDGNTGKLRSVITTSNLSHHVNDKVVLNSAQSSQSMTNESTLSNTHNLVATNKTLAIAATTIFKCDHCSKAFQSADNLEQHRIYFHRFGKNHSETIGLSNNGVESSAVNKAPFVIPATGLRCKDCKRIFASSSGLEAHRRTTHNAVKIEPKKAMFVN